MIALVLDRTHRGLVAEVPVSGPRWIKTVIAALAERGIAVPAPAGSRPRDGTRDFAFVVDQVPGARPLSELGDAAWELYVAVMLGGWEAPTRTFDVWSFGDQPEMAARLVHLVACGAKRVTMGWVDAAARSNTPLAVTGGVSVVTDGFGYPRVVVRSADVRVVPFAEIDEASAAGEGEGDLTYEDWREGHTAYFTAEAARYGLVFDERAAISIERFDVLRVIGS